MLSIVIPTLNAAETLGATLSSVKGSGLAPEVLVADGGSEDFTAGLARKAGVPVLEAARGRGSQLAAGAKAARGDWLLFLHADTVLAPGWAEAVEDFMLDPANLRRAGYFRFALEAAAPAARRLERLVAWRCRRLGLPYGDQGLLLSRQFYEDLGGYQPLPLMEDVDLVQRIGPARLALLPATAITSAVRYRNGYLARSALNLACLGLWRLGVSPRTLARLYG